MTQVEIDERVRLGDPDPSAGGGVCGDCHSFREPEVSDGVPPIAAHTILRAMRGFGLCVECPDSPTVVPARELHEGTVGGGCWGPR